MVYKFWLARGMQNDVLNKKGFSLLLNWIVIFATLNLGQPYYFIQHF